MNSRTIEHEGRTYRVYPSGQVSVKIVPQHGSTHWRWLPRKAAAKLQQIANS